MRQIQVARQPRLVGSVAEWSKALVLGTSLFGGVGSNPTAASYQIFDSLLISPPAHVEPVAIR